MKLEAWSWRHAPLLKLILIMETSHKYSHQTRISTEILNRTVWYWNSGHRATFASAAMWTLEQWLLGWGIDDDKSNRPTKSPQRCPWHKSAAILVLKVSPSRWHLLMLEYSPALSYEAHVECYLLWKLLSASRQTSIQFGNESTYFRWRKPCRKVI